MTGWLKPVVRAQLPCRPKYVALLSQNKALIACTSEELVVYDIYHRRMLSRELFSKVVKIAEKTDGEALALVEDGDGYAIYRAYEDGEILRDHTVKVEEPRVLHADGDRAIVCGDKCYVIDDEKAELRFFDPGIYPMFAVVAGDHAIVTSYDISNDTAKVSVFDIRRMKVTIRYEGERDIYVLDGGRFGRFEYVVARTENGVAMFDASSGFLSPVWFIANSKLSSVAFDPETATAFLGHMNGSKVIMVDDQGFELGSSVIGAPMPHTVKPMSARYERLAVAGVIHDPVNIDPLAEPTGYVSLFKFS